MITLFRENPILIDSAKTKNKTILLVDNGSIKVDAAVQLRHLAEKLNRETGEKIYPVSLKHSDKINNDDVLNKLAGNPARVFSEFIRERLHLGEREFILMPLFFGKSRALTSFVPDEKAILEKEFGEFELSMAEVLYPLPKGDSALVEILYDHANAAELNNLVLVDHGSPLPAVNEVRQHITTALQSKLPNGIKVNQAAMERRQGKAYDFNGELLEDYLIRIAEAGETQANVLLLFLLPGTHAGENGDISQICQKVMKKHPNFKVSISPLISQNEKLVSLLAKRLKPLMNE